MEQLNCRLEIKSLDAEGKFTGLASVYGNVDLGGDVVQPGAFQKTIADRGGEVPLLFAHDMRQPIGLAKLQDTARGLAVDGQLVLDVPKAKEAYSLLKARVLRGLSIGYDAVKSDIVGGVRHLKELKLFEVSIVVVPMNEMATVTAVKSEDVLGEQVRLFRQVLAESRKAFR
ncbi:MAG: HK97 family phage prohead protease [Terriglobales bacterium]